MTLEGVCTGEHAVGLHKIDFLVTEVVDGAVNMMMRTTTRSLDSPNIINLEENFQLVSL